MGAGQADTPRFTIAMVTHGPPGDTFWDLIRKGAETAAAKDNIELKYSAELQALNRPTSSKTLSTARSTASPSRLPSRRPGLGRRKRADSAGIPVVAFNAGIDAWKAQGAKAYFGQDEKISGEAAGKRLATEGAQESRLRHPGPGERRTRIPLRRRQGRLWRRPVENLNVNGTDMPSVESTITAKLQQDPSIDYRHDVGCAHRVGRRAIGEDREQQGQDRHLRHQRGTRGRHQGGQVQWAVDQQPFLQGYLAIDSLWLYLNNRNSIGGGKPALTGPAFIDKSNIDAIAEYAKNGTR